MPPARKRATVQAQGQRRPGELSSYRAKRDFTKTSEPAGSEPAREAGELRRFVVQRHRASRLHYDFRLEIGGVLVSWAVPKGPTLDPSVRRAAFHVEDHPLEYFDFEGVIPAGEYGGGDVIVWDEGTFAVDEAGDPPDPSRALRQGELHLDLFGQKLRGRFLLVRTRTDAAGKEQWLLLHKHDEFAIAGWEPEDHPRSVLSGRTNDEVKAQPKRMWRSDLPAGHASVPVPAYRAGPGPASATQEQTRSAEHASRRQSPGRRRGPSAPSRPSARLDTLPSRHELEQLDDLGPNGTWSIFGRELRVTNLDKVLFPAREGEEAVTKRDLLRYTAQVALVALPYLAGRALNMHRFPNGAESSGFWHKQLPTHAPDWVPRWDNPGADAGETGTYLVVDEPGALVWAANFGALEWHAWTSKTDQPQSPTYALIDLDPGDKTTWEDLLVLARLHRAALEHLGVRAQPKLTGRRGIQIWVPVKRGPRFSETRRWTEALSRTVGAVVPELVSWKWHVGERGGLARLDYTQNAINKTLVAPYSPRPAPGAPVSAPITWDELDDPSLAPDRFTVRSIVPRLLEQGDLFATVLDGGQELPDLA